MSLDMVQEGDMGIHDLLEGDASLLEHGADDNSGGRRPHLPAQRSLIQGESLQRIHQAFENISHAVRFNIRFWYGH